jgi:multicomponent Na+:H+ antiporter subunit B
MVVRHVILRSLSKMLIPLIMLFALYVQFHGDYGPGGGFQAGVIFGAGIILYSLIFGLSKARMVFRPRFLQFLMAFGVFLYGSVGFAAILKGGNFLGYSFLAHDPVHGQHLGILLVELGVGITVCSVMATLFFLFTERRRREDV